MTTKKAETEKRRISRELRQLYKERKPLLTGRHIVDVGWWGVPFHTRACGVEACEGCGTREWLREKAEPLTQRIEELKQNLQQLDPKPETTRKATVITGRGEQLVMFV